MSRLSTVLLDTHVLLWILSRSKRLKEIPKLELYPFWTISPVSLLELKFLHEIGRIALDQDGILTTLRQDTRFKIDNISLEDVCFQAMNLDWTRDPFDRLLVAHSLALNIPLATCDRLIQENYSHII